MKITRKLIEAAKKGIYSIEERVDEAGFVYFPDGRVAWKINENAADPEDFEVEVFESWGFPTKTQTREIMRLIAAYVGFNRQNKETTCPGSR